MSTFFKALEQAERERVLRERAERREAAAAGVGAPTPERAPDPAQQERPVPPVAPITAFRRPEPEPTPALPEEPPDGVEEHLVSLLAPNSPAAEQYLAVRDLLEQLHKGATLSVVAVSSPSIGDGKTITVINLAGALAQALESRVLLLDADLRRSSVAQRLGLEGSESRGLVDAILNDKLSLQDVVELRRPFNLSILRAGRCPSAPYELLKSPRLGQLLQEARRHYDYVLLDTPPLLPLPDCRAIGRWVDGFLVVVTAHKTPRKLLQEALNVLEATKIVGLVFNGDDQPLGGYFHQHGGFSEPEQAGRRGRWRQRRGSFRRGSE